MDRPLEREFAERAQQRALAEDRQQIEALVQDREWNWASEHARPCGPDDRPRPWERGSTAGRRSPRPAALVVDPEWAERTFGEEGGLSVAELRALPYASYLRTPHWQDLRYRALLAAEHRCQSCNRGSQLDVHHRTYERLGEERLADLTVLCRSCHTIFHQHLDLVRPGQAKPQPQSQEEACTSSPHDKATS